MPRPIPPSRFVTWLVGASFVVLAFCLYRKILGAPFLFDDGDFVVRSDARAAQRADPIVFYETELRYNPTARVYNNLGNAYSELGQDDRAIYCYQESLKLRTDYPRTYHNVARVTYRNTHDVVAALNYYYQALSLRPSFSDTHLELSQLYQGLGEPELARVHADFCRRALAGEALTDDEIKRRVAPLLKLLLAKLGQ